MSEMVERLTAVLREKLDYSGNHGDAAFKDAAEAILTAMREPSDGIVQKLSLSLPARAACNEVEVVSRIWRGLIDEALR